MGKLAISGGTPVRTKPWPAWPVWDARDEAALLGVLRSGAWGYNGPREAEFAERFAAFQDARYGLLVNSGTAALQIALEAADVGAGDEVIVPGLTWQATALCVLDVSAVPVLVDVDPETFCLDPRLAEAAITPRTRAIIPVHLYGCMADLDALRDLARRRNLALIEDCAHTHDSRWRGQGAGSLGDVGCFSFQSTKLLNAAEGGAVLTNDKRLYEKLYSLKNCGRRREGCPPEEFAPLNGGSYRLTEFQAAVLLAQLERLPEQTARREANARYLDAHLGRIPGISAMRRDPRVTHQGHYIYTFRYDAGEFGGAPLDRFIAALNAECGPGFNRVNEPLNACSLYLPHTKPRYRWSEEYWAAIDPTRFDLPVSTRIHNHTGVGLRHQNLLGTEDDMADIVRTVEKVRANAGELREG